MTDYKHHAKGYIVKNKEKKTDKHPSFKGSMTLDEDLPAGSKLWIAGWNGEFEDGTPNIGMKMTLAEEKPAKERSSASKPQEPIGNNLDDEIPF